MRSQQQQGIAGWPIMADFTMLIFAHTCKDMMFDVPVLSQSAFAARALQMLGVHVGGPRQATFNGLHLDFYPRVTWSPSFAMTVDDLKVQTYWGLLPSHTRSLLEVLHFELHSLQEMPSFLRSWDCSMSACSWQKTPQRAACHWCSLVSLVGHIRPAVICVPHHS